MDPRPATHHYLRMSMLCHSGEALARQLDKTVTVAVDKYVVKHKSAKLFMMYAIGKAALNTSHLVLSTSSQRVS